MIALCVGLLGCTNTFVQPIIHCPAFGSVLQLRFEVFEKSATAYTCSSTGRDFTRYAKSLCQHICGHWALKLQNIFTKYKILIKMQQYVYFMVLRKISVCKQSHWAGLPFSSFPVCSTQHRGLCGCDHTKVLLQLPQLQLNSVREAFHKLRKRQ